MNEGLSSGDRKIIRNIAIASWRSMLGRVLSTPGGVKGLGLMRSYTCPAFTDGQCTN